MDEHTPETDETPDFGPTGYLPDRASRRARKIVLRAPMGIQWVIGAGVVGLGLLIVAIALVRGDRPPEAPYVLVQSDGATPVFGEDVTFTLLGGDGFEEPIIVVGEGRPRVLRVDREPTPVFCDENGLLEASDGGTWRVTGRGLGGTASLAEHPSIVYEGALYADPTRVLPVQTPSDDVVPQACGGVLPGPAPASAPEG